MRFYNDALMWRGLGNLLGQEVVGAEERDSDATPYDLSIPREIDGLPVLSVAEGAFSDNLALRRVVIPSSVQHIGSGAFDPYYFIKPLRQGVFNGATCVAWDAFKRSRGFELDEIVVHDDNERYRSIDGVLFSKDGSEALAYPAARADSRYDVPEKVEIIREGAFSGSENLRSIKLPKSVRHVDPQAFYCCFSLEEILVDADNAAFRTIDGALYTRDGSRLVAYPAGRRGTYRAPESLAIVGEGAFCGCSDLAEATEFERVREIEANGFLGCSALSLIDSLASCAQIGRAAFADCLSLREAILNDAITEIPKNAFQRCSSLENFEFPRSTRFVGARAFMGCSALAEVSLPETIERIEAEAFKDCDELRAITIPESVKEIGVAAFANCLSLSSARITDGVEIVRECAFENCPSLASIVLPLSLKKIGADAFDEDMSLLVYSDSYAELWARANERFYDVIL